MNNIDYRSYEPGLQRRLAYSISIRNQRRIENTIGPIYFGTHVVYTHQLLQLLWVKILVI